MERLTICFDGQGRTIQSRELQSRLDAPDEWYARRPDQAGRFYLPRVARVELENLREAGCDDAEIGSITGMSQSIIRRYSALPIRSGLPRPLSADRTAR